VKIPAIRSARSPGSASALSMRKAPRNAAGARHSGAGQEGGGRHRGDRGKGHRDTGEQRPQARRRELVTVAVNRWRSFARRFRQRAHHAQDSGCSRRSPNRRAYRSTCRGGFGPTDHQVRRGAPRAERERSGLVTIFSMVSGRAFATPYAGPIPRKRIGRWRREVPERNAWSSASTTTWSSAGMTRVCSAPGVAGPASLSVWLLTVTRYPTPRQVDRCGWPVQRCR
jgi:hypothetical protein